MTETRRGCLIVLTVLAVASGRAQTASGPPAPADSCRRFGLMFDVQAAPHFSSLTSYADGGYSISLGFGLNFSPMFQLTIQVYTGREAIPPGSVKPVDGWLPLGGVSLDATMFFSSGGAIRPYGTAGFGLYTISGGNGYNGGGVHIEAGIEWDFSRFFSLRGGARYDVMRFHDPTGEAYQAAGFVPFTLRLAGASVRAAFYPSILP